MAKVDVDSILRLPIPEKIAKVRQIVKAMTDNPDFPNPDPPLEQLTASADELEQSYYAQLASERAAEEAEKAYEEAAKAFVELMKDQPRH